IEAWPAKTLTLDHCDDDLRHLRGFGARPKTLATTAEVERLVRQHGSVREAARELGVSPATAYRLLPSPRRQVPSSRGHEA
ncbi:MAG: hypothetical protein ACRDL7_12690, partial [Gaiellaceae bacterium]